MIEEIQLFELFGVRASVFKYNAIYKKHIVFLNTLELKPDCWETDTFS